LLCFVEGFVCPQKERVCGICMNRKTGHAKACRDVE